jgi:hypothetical protein
MLMRGLPPWREWRGGYHHDEEEDLLLGAGAPPKGGCPLLPYKTPSLSSKSHTCWFFPLPQSCCPKSILALRSSAGLLVRVLHTWRSECWSVRRIPSSAAPLDRGRGGVDDKPYVYPSTGAPPVVAPCTRSRDRQVNHYVNYVKWTTTSTTCIFLDSPSATFVRERNPRYRSSRVSLRCYHLVDVLG